MLSTTRRALLSLTAIIGIAAGTATAATAEAPLPAGKTPSEIAKMVCEKKAVTEINAVLGERAKISTPTWKNHLYSCDYRYATGTMVLSVKELSSAAQTTSYFNGLAKALHKNLTLYGLPHNEGAFRGRNGSVVVRKDWKVLIVGVAGLPSQFGSPKTSVDEVALTVAGLIMGCWSGD